MGIGFLLLRLIVELILTSHGARKLFGWFGGPAGVTRQWQARRRPGAVSFWRWRYLR